MISLRTFRSQRHTPLPQQSAAEHITPLKPVFYDASKRRKCWYYSLWSLLLIVMLAVLVSFTASLLMPPSLPAHVLRNAESIRRDAIMGTQLNGMTSVQAADQPTSVPSGLSDPIKSRSFSITP
ncbi:MAG TPA: hypothetical protein VFT66_10815 [Roseiflexaceae bacterium]|jgi:hypothetical protein|nr:hypothetical protein [Roseiflexaceae bacterium]